MIVRHSAGDCDPLRGAKIGWQSNSIMWHQMIDIEVGCQNVYADLGSVDAEAMQRKAQLMFRIGEVIQAKGLSLAQAAKMTNMSFERLEILLKGQFREANEAELTAYLRLLDREVRAGR